MVSNGSLPVQAIASSSANMALLDNNTDSDSESEYFDASENLEESYDSDSDSDDEFQDARDSFSDEVDPAEVELPESNNKQHQEASKRLEDEKNSTATNSVLAEKRKFDYITEEDQETASKSPKASGSSCGVSDNRQKKLKPVIAFGQSTGFGGMKTPQALSSIRTTAPTAGLFKTDKPFSFIAATTHDNNTMFNNASTSKVQDNKENNIYTFGEGPRSVLAGVEEIKVKTGEEEEDTICQAKGKLYALDSTRGWKERGTGTFRLKKNNNNSESRLVMRTDGVHRLILNAKLFPGMSASIVQDKFIKFGIFETVTNEEGKTATKLANYALKLGSATTADEICQHIASNIPPAPAPKRTHDALEDEDDEPPSPKEQSKHPKKQRNL